MARIPQTPSHPPDPRQTSIDVEVRYAETDQMGVVHHAVYPVWFELARTRQCAETGYAYLDIEKMGYSLMVTSLALDYRRSATYGDTVTVTCLLSRFASRVLGFAYEVQRDGDLLVAGSTGHVWIDNHTGKPCRIPEVLRQPFAALAPQSIHEG
ncbi:MAG: acyl-CoA thioesterase [Acidobacteriota bacterium]|nr:acyl-CoA thioesterase [Acidobacteriota bacterium]